MVDRSVPNFSSNLRNQRPPSLETYLLSLKQSLNFDQQDSLNSLIKIGNLTNTSLSAPLTIKEKGLSLFSSFMSILETTQDLQHKSGLQLKDEIGLLRLEKYFLITILKEAITNLFGKDGVPKFFNDPFLEYQFKKIAEQPQKIKQRKQSPQNIPAQPFLPMFKGRQRQNTPLMRTEEVVLKLNDESDDSMDKFAEIPDSDDDDSQAIRATKRCQLEKQNIPRKIGVKLDIGHAKKVKDNGRITPSRQRKQWGITSENKTSKINLLSSSKFSNESTANLRYQQNAADEDDHYDVNLVRSDHDYNPIEDKRSPLEDFIRMF